jgi:hypothetical protein
MKIAAIVNRSDFMFCLRDIVNRGCLGRLRHRRLVFFSLHLHSFNGRSQHDRQYRDKEKKYVVPVMNHGLAFLLKSSVSYLSPVTVFEYGDCSAPATAMTL